MSKRAKVQRQTLATYDEPARPKPPKSGAVAKRIARQGTK